jgi:hypothetical protein
VAKVSCLDLTVYEKIMLKFIIKFSYFKIVLNFKCGPETFQALNFGSTKLKKLKLQYKSKIGKRKKIAENYACLAKPTLS